MIHPQENNTPDLHTLAISEILHQFRLHVFDPARDSGQTLPDSPGNYLFCLKEDVLFSPKATLLRPVFTSFDGLRVVYTGIASRSIRSRDYRSHFGDNAGRSTFRKSLGVLFGYPQIPRDKDPSTGKTKFNAADEANLTRWMKASLLMFYCVNPKCASYEEELIDLFRPPLNLSKNHSNENEGFRQALSRLRVDKDVFTG